MRIPVNSFLCILSLSCLIVFTAADHSNARKGKVIKIDWVNKLDGDYSFVDKWDYPVGVYVNEYGQLSCDGFCPERAWGMKDSTGKIIGDSLSAFYSIVDTSHQHYSLSVDAWCYENAGTNYMTCVSKGKDKFECVSACDIATHSSLMLSIRGNECYPTVYLNTIIDTANTTFYCTGGTISMERESLEKGMLKAEFDLTFENTFEKEKPIYWRGKLFAPVLDSHSK